MSWWVAYIGLGLFAGLWPAGDWRRIGDGADAGHDVCRTSSVPANEVLHLALGTSVATILFTSISSLRTHHQHGAALWKAVIQITPGILLHGRERCLR